MNETTINKCEWCNEEIPLHLRFCDKSCIANHTNANRSKESFEKKRQTLLATNERKRQERKAEYEKNPRLCKQCNDPIPFEFDNRQLYCSNLCVSTYNNLKNETRSEEIIQRKSDIFVEEIQNEGKSYICMVCFENFGSNHKAYASHININHTDLEKTIALQKQKEEYEKNPKLCKECNNAILFEKNHRNYCNNSCAAIYYVKLNGMPQQTIPKIKEICTCLNCNEEFEKKKNTFGVYCSNQCQQDYQWKQKKKTIIINGTGNKNNLKRYLADTFGHKCVDCGVGNIYNDKPLTLQIHHKDGNHNNNSIHNVELLCPNCHSQTDTYTWKNIKNPDRRKLKI